MPKPDRDDRVTLRFISAALQRINEHMTDPGYREARRRIQLPENTEDDIRDIVREFCNEEVKL